MAISVDAPTRVILVCLHWNEHGGLETVTVDMARAIQESGASLEVISVFDAGMPEVRGLRARGLAPRDHLLRKIYNRMLWKARLHAAIRSRLIPGAVVIVGHARLANAVLRAQRVSRPFPTVLWAHGLEVWGEPGRALAPELARMTRVVCVSHFTAAEVKRHAPQARTMVIPNSVDTARFQPMKEPPPSSVPTIMSCCRLERQAKHKNVDALISLLPEVERRVGAPVRLRVVGDGDWSAELQSLAATLGVAERVVFEGRVSDERLVALYQECTVFCLPSRLVRRDQGYWGGEGFGLVYVQAAACGRPVVGSTDGGANEAVVDGQTGYNCDPTNHEALIGALVRIIKDPGLQQRMGAAGREWVVRNFGQETFNRRVSAMLGEIAREARVGARQAALSAP